MNKLNQLVILNLGAISLLSLGIAGITTRATAQQESECLIVTPSGEVMDLSYMCQSSSEPKSEFLNESQPSGRVNSTLSDYSPSSDQRTTDESSIISESNSRSTNRRLTKRQLRKHQRELQQQQLFDRLSQYQQYRNYYLENQAN